MSFSSTHSADQLNSYLLKQLTSFFPDSSVVDDSLTKKYIDVALTRVEYCFSKIKNKYYGHDGSVLFNHINGDQYSIFLYFVSNEAYKDGNRILYEKISYLNKVLHSIDLFGHIDMPDIFQLAHPLGTVIGRAKIGSYIIIYQNVTIGGTHNDGQISYPKISDSVICYSNSSILGDSTIGSNTIIGSSTSIINTDIPANSVVTGRFPELTIRPNKFDIKQTYFN